MLISDRVRMVFKAMVDALLGKIEDPQAMLENTYAELHLALASGRQKLANLLAIEAQLKIEIETLEKVEAQVKEAIASGEKNESELGQLKEKLRRVQHEIAELKRILSELEDDVGKAYTRKPGRLTHITSEIRVGKAITADGSTWDREIHSDSEGVPEKVPMWLLLAILLTIVLLIGFFAQWYPPWGIIRNSPGGFIPEAPVRFSCR